MGSSGSAVNPRLDDGLPTITEFTLVKKNDDPNFAKEAERYDDPIPSREYILQRLAEIDLFVDEIGVGKRVGLRAKRHMEPLRRRLRAMVRDGQLIENRHGKVRVPNNDNAMIATVTAHPDGFGFAKIEGEQHEDVFLGPKAMRDVLHGDRVRIMISPADDKGRFEGWVSDIVERGFTELSGRVIEKRGAFQLLPRDHRIHTDVVIEGGEIAFSVGDTVNAKVLHYPRGRLPTVVTVIDRIDEPNGLDGQIQMALNARDMSNEFSADVLATAKKLGDAVTEADKNGRLDLRDRPFVTIDGEDSRDFDDAVFVEQSSDQWTLWVAIADVAHYVEAGSPLDHAAYERGTSVYFPDRVVPMLPEAISNGLCSLNPHVDRLCLVAQMTIDCSGELVDTRFSNAVMNSHARLTYTEVNAALFEDNAQARQQHESLLPALEALKSLYLVLRSARAQRGAMDFDSVEPRFHFSEDNTIENITVSSRNDAHRLIEECMILANVAAARYLQEKNLPVLMRIHDGPKAERVENLQAFLATKALTLGGALQPSVHDYAKLATEIKGRPDAVMLQSMLLRSMNQARYAPVNDGHFGLALDAYAHFTSPIRRYPDLTVHRMLKFTLETGKKAEYPVPLDAMLAVGEHCSATERTAEEAVRDVVDWLKCEYMSHHIGDEFEGIVSAVTAFGAFITLNDLYIDGLIHVTQLPDDYYDYEPALMSLIGRRSSRAISLGQSVRVAVAAVTLDDKRIDLQLVSELDAVPRTNKRAEKPSQSKKPTRRRR